MITVTGGHGDFRQPFELPRIGSPADANGTDRRQHGRRQPRRCARARARRAADAGREPDAADGRRRITSPHSPLDVSTFTEPELRAAVEAAENWGTYVTVHAYTPAAITRAISAGVKCVDGHLMDEPTARSSPSEASG